MKRVGPVLETPGPRFHLEHLPPYSPEFNATERIWHYMRIQAIHALFLDTCSLFYRHYVVLFMRVYIV